ncbi:hypothetical protein EC2865200_4820 [Escherichia coli 2865200]|nr:hypothetical protein EC2865200_4820 [Escherichia coli 2865200]
MNFIQEQKLWPTDAFEDDARKRRKCHLTTSPSVLLFHFLSSVNDCSHKIACDV